MFSSIIFLVAFAGGYYCAEKGYGTSLYNLVAKLWGGGQ